MEQRRLSDLIVSPKQNITRCPRCGRALIAAIGETEKIYCWSCDRTWPEMSVLSEMSGGREK